MNTILLLSISTIIGVGLSYYFKNKIDNSIGKFKEKKTCLRQVSAVKRLRGILATKPSSTTLEGGTRKDRWTDRNGKVVAEKETFNSNDFGSVTSTLFSPEGKKIAMISSCCDGSYHGEETVTFF